MSRWRWLPAAGLVLAGLPTAGVPAVAAPFTYHDYDGMVAELEAFEAAHPGLVDHFTAQEAWGLPPVADGELELAQHVLRITNEALGLDKPEVLLVAVQHGNEVVGLEVCLETARLLLEGYGTDPWLTELVDRREIYVVALANPWGFNHQVRQSPGGEGFEDMNRDHVYDRCETFCSDEETLSTLGARAVHELARRHLFRVMLDFHGGVELILHPWGSPLHGGHTESPDARAATLLGLRLRDYGGPFRGFSPVGTAGDLLGPVHGPLDDSAYAASWDVGNVDMAWPTDGWRAAAYTIEISDQKRPPVSTLGGDAEPLVPGGSEDGYVPKNLRVALAAIDVAEPWIRWTNRKQVPVLVDAGEPVTVEWQVRGCFEVDDTRVRFGTDPDPLATFSGQTAAQQQTSGDPCFDLSGGEPATFTAEVTFSEPGTWYLTPAARVDSSLLEQDDPNPPGTAPQTWLVRVRTEDGLYFENAVEPGEVNTVRGQLYWGTQPLQIEVVADGLIFADGFESGDTSAWNGER